MASTYKFIEIETRDKTGRMTLNRPPVNVINIEMLREIRTGLTELARDTSLRVITMGAHGKFFSAGMDVDDHRPENAETSMKRVDFGRWKFVMIRSAPRKR